jgi:uncharacterized membrane protein YozB (DUF420 family)
MSATALQIQSTLIVILFLYGLYLAKNHQRSKHIKVMSFAMTWDIILILQIELSRFAIEKAVKVNENSLLLNIHVSLGVSCVVLYGVVMYLGWKTMTKRPELLKTHKKLGKIALLTRLLTYITSFLALP